MSPSPRATYWLLNHDPLRLPAADVMPLSAEEERAARFHFPEDAARHRYFHSRMREILAEALSGKAPAATLEFALGPHGKPFLPAHPNLHFNLTHSQSHAALVASEAGPVGIDIEIINAQFPCAEVADEYFCPAEKASVCQAPDTATAAARFYRLWTAKEAIMKATGLGMILEPPQIQLTLDPASQAPIGIHSLRHPGCHASQWQLHFPPQPPGLALAIVTRWGVFLNGA